MNELPRQTDGDLMLARQDAKSLYGALDDLLAACDGVRIEGLPGAVTRLENAKDEAEVMLSSLEGDYGPS